MKIERLSESQIRCTLNKNDLLDRELKISEFAYGTEKAKELFQELIGQAEIQYGFDTEDAPLMIEAIPVSPECLVLIVTKVDDPEELDTRFSNFTPYENHTGSEPEEESVPAHADEILHYFEALKKMLTSDDQNGFREGTTKKDGATDKGPRPGLNLNSPTPILPTIEPSVSDTLFKVYSFRSLAHVTELAHVLAPFYHGQNTLYKDPAQRTFYLILRISDHTPEEFNKVCNIASEYGTALQANYASLSFYEEHYETVIRDRASAILHQLG